QAACANRGRWMPAVYFAELRFRLITWPCPPPQPAWRAQWPGRSGWRRSPAGGAALAAARAGDSPATRRAHPMRSSIRTMAGMQLAHLAMHRRRDPRVGDGRTPIAQWKHRLVPDVRDQAASQLALSAPEYRAAEWQRVP